ncbi:hypothetical protein SAMN05720606_10457 [Paenibacillus polysaccharolyticus]|uniref:Uncharacterized protein n=1 Tax=Paenibacillus polysaccharolyticus TaxID=582692 RepID=A0A1G5F564_9BACL|nr:hypothetical protein [Paenibacillus polysaccharolyticus]SCY34324.1 hypothetical protein SAMN05720606_10457 [Paenibacillus polysaccharolyticus]
MKPLEIKQLPDVLSKETLEKYLSDYLSFVENTEKLNKLEVLESLSEFADRKVYTHQLLDANLKLRTDQLVQTLLDISSEDVVDSYANVVVNLNLEESYELMKSVLDLELTEKVREIIEETIDEVGDNINIPYQSN